MDLRTDEKKLLYELSIDCRAPRKALAKTLRKSPPLLNYTIEKLKKQNTYTEHTIIDPSRFGLHTIKVVFSYITSSPKERKEVLAHLLDHPFVTFVQHVVIGADLFATFTTFNHSQFNKIITDFTNHFSKQVKISDIYPIIVTYHFPKLYLNPRKRNDEHKITAGDRRPHILSKNEFGVLRAVQEQPAAPYTTLSTLADVDRRTVRSTLSQLKNKDIVKLYSITLNYDACTISTSTVLVHYHHLSKAQDRKIIQYCKSNPNMVQIQKVLSRGSMLFTFESFGNTTKLIKSFCQEFNFYDYHVFECGNIVKQNSIPTDPSIQDYLLRPE